MSPTTWSALGRIAPKDLHEARLALHYAAQPLAAAAYAALPMREDHSHTNLLWNAGRGGFVGRLLANEGRLFLDPADLRIGLLSGSGEEVEALELRGMTLREAFTQLGQALRRAGIDVPAERLELPEYDLPDSGLTRGDAFSADPAALSELASWFHNANLALSGAAQSLLQGAEVRGWPHHFDLAALRTLDRDLDPESARSVGAGFSPGDDSYPEQYFYVSPWPALDAAKLPALPAGAHWHTQGFTSAVLPAQAVVAAGSADAQERAVSRYLHMAIESSLGLLER